MPLAMGKESLLDFLSGWHVTPIHTFRHGFRRTWIVRATTDPIETIIQHDFGIAVVKEAVAKPRVVATERFQAPVRTASTFMRKTASNYPKSWVGVVSGNSNQPKDSTPTKSVSDGAIAASAVPVAPRTQPVVSARAPSSQQNLLSQPIAPSTGPFAHLGNPADLANLMVATIEAALKPLREKLEATIVPMQRTIESLQAEFVAMREEKADDVMQQAGVTLEAQEAKRMRIGNVA